jgi:biotin-dependent carboxylase-like uncharacterized protein
VSRSALEVVRPGPLSTVQDLGRPGLAALGIGRAGAADRGSLRLANRLVGNAEPAAGIEATFGGLSVRAHGDLVIAVTGAPCALRCHRSDGARSAASRPADGAMNAPLQLADGTVLTLGTPRRGLRSYLAVRGGVDVPPVLGSRSTDILAGIGPDPLAAGSVLPVGTDVVGDPLVDVAAVPEPAEGVVDLAIAPGPRADWFAAGALETLATQTYEVTSESNRVGMRLAGPALARAREDELPSEGMVPGALQVPPSGVPTLFLVDHPVTGGYPVIAVVRSGNLDRAAQVRPGQRLRFHAPDRPHAVRRC